MLGLKGSSALILLSWALLAGSFSLAGSGPDFKTPFEESDGLETPRYAETTAWCSDLAATSELLHYTTFGTSPQGRELPLLVADSAGRFHPDDHSSRSDHIVLLVEACIHAGESCGKDAGMLLLRDLVQNRKLADELLDKVTLLFIPIFNVDGHERFGPFGRINQNGPSEMGWRVTSQNLNLNRDFLKADTPEMKAWLALFKAWQPDFLIDIHSTDGADYQYPVTYGLEVHGNLEAGLTQWVVRYRDAMISSMALDGYPMAPYVSFRDWHDPRSGLNSWAAGPRFSQGYAAIRNRPGLLVETHMLKDYSTRVWSTHALLIHSMAWLNAEAGPLSDLIVGADNFTSSPEFRSQPFPLDFAASDIHSDFEFQGVEYEEKTSEITGGSYMEFSDRPQNFSVEFFDDLNPSVTTDLPEGYIVPVEWTEAIDRLDLHGIRYFRLKEDARLDIRTVSFSDTEWRQAPYEGRHPLTFSTSEIFEDRTFPAESVIVPMDQPLARVAAHLLEPNGPDSLVQWGFFDSIFERVEYVESYVIEAMIPGMLAEHPEWAAELAAQKLEDPEFASDPWAIRYWFYEKTKFYDQRVGIYPVGMVDDAKIVKALLTENAH